MLKNVLINSSPRRVIISSSISSSSSSASSVEKNEHFSFVEAKKRTDLEIERFQKNVALLCPTDCGKCCSSPNVEASEGEMRLVAERLEGDGLAEFYFGKLESSRTMKHCVFSHLFQKMGIRKVSARCTNRDRLCVDSSAFRVEKTKITRLNSLGANIKIVWT